MGFVCPFSTLRRTKATHFLPPCKPLPDAVPSSLPATRRRTSRESPSSKERKPWRGSRFATYSSRGEEASL